MLQPIANIVFETSILIAGLVIYDTLRSARPLFRS